LNDEDKNKYKWVYQEGMHSEGEPCNKLCNGIMNLRINPVCKIDNGNTVEAALCPRDQMKPKYITKPCNTDCQLRYVYKLK
jgi:hypothetical protein